MKRILFTLIVLLGTVGTWAQVTSITDGGVYTIQFKKNSWYFSPTLKTTSTNPGSFRFDEVAPEKFTIFSVEEGKYITRGDSPANGGTPTLSETLEDTDNFKWVATFNGNDWLIKTTDQAFCLNGWTNSLSESNDVKFYFDATHDLAPLVLCAAPSAEQKAAQAKAEAWTGLITSTSTALMSNSNQWVSDAADAVEGWLDRLTDNDLTNYFHSDWHGSYSGTHYIEATLPEATNSLLLYYYTRSTGTGCPTNITVSASVDGETWVDGLATINESDMPTAGSKGYLSKPLTFNASYSHFRFYVPSTNSGVNSWFCLAEANLYATTPATAEAMTLAHIAAVDLTAEQIARINALDTELRSTTVNVTYELYESDGTAIGSEVVIQEKNSEAVSPFAVSSYYDYAVDGTIGTSDCTIKVTRTLKADIVYPISSLSNSKVYRIDVPRGTYTVNNGLLANTVKNSAFAINYFALINYEDNYYMWSVEANKFVAGDGATLTDTPVAVAFSASTVPSYQIKSGSNTLNATAGFTTGAGFDAYSAADAGNQCVIYEIEDFDATDVIAALEEFFHPAGEIVYAELIASLETLSYGTEYGQYGLSGDFAGKEAEASTIISELKAQGYTEENLTRLQAMAEATSLNTPAAGYYYVKNVVTGKYLAAKDVTGWDSSESSVFADAEKGAAAIIELVAQNDGTLYMYNQNHGFGWIVANGEVGSGKAWVTSAPDKYVNWFPGNAAGQIAFAICYGNGTGDYASYLLKGIFTADNEGVVVAGSDYTAEAAQWIFEEANDVTLSLNAAGGKSYATTYLPFGVKLGGDVKAYTLTVNGEYATPAEIGTDVPAGTPVLLVSETGAASVTAAIDDELGTIGLDNELQGTFFAATPAAYVLNAVDGVVGFYTLDEGGVLAANHAYLPKTAGVKGYALDLGLATAVESVEGAQTAAAIYNLAGQRVNKAQKGVFIVNGKKVIK